MNNDWNSFLEQQNLDNAPSQADCALSDLSDHGLIRIGGEDAREFLQGQLTNDINLVDESTGQLGALCNPKGRIFASMNIFQRDREIYLQLPAERLEAILMRMRMFVLRSRVTLEDVSDELVAIGLSGDCIHKLIGQVPEQAMQQVKLDDLNLMRMPGELSRVQLIGPVDSIIAFWKQLPPEVTLVNRGFWALQNIREGVPNVYNSTAEAFIPQTLNLQLLNGISFNKGCYTGQEIIARMKYLGQVKRRMYLAHFDAEVQPAPGDRLYSASSKSGQGAGQIVDVRPDPAGGYAALVMIQISTAEADDLQLLDDQGPRMELSEPPYGFETE
jgi:folate-binding protein YgfZ